MSTSLGATQRESARWPHAATAALVKAGAALFLIGAVVWLMDGRASGDTIFALLRFWVFGLTLPGLALWRIATTRRLSLVEDVAAGSVVGAAVLLLVYLGVSPLGLQQWAWLWAVPVLAAAAIVPAWRERCLQRVSAPLSPAAAWFTAIASLLPLYTLARFRNPPAPYSDPRVSSPDMAFHQALAASAKFDFPLQAPYVDGEQMSYHYFFHQFTAATSWATGVDLTDLIYTVGWMPLLLAGSALILGLTERLAPRSSWAGPLAIVVATIGGTLQPYPGFALPSENTAGYAVASPTQNLGGALVVLLSILAVDLLRGQRRVGTWVLFIVAAAAASGAKATVLPLIVCGFGLVVFVRLCQRRFAGAALIALAVGGVFFGLAIVVIFGRHSSGMAIRPWRVFARLVTYQVIAEGPVTETDTRALWISAIVCCVAWLLGTAGLLVLFAQPRRLLRDPGAIFLIGVSIAGFVAMLLTDQPGASQLYFHRTAVPVIAALAAAGAWMLVSRFADRWSGVMVAASLLVGLVAAWGSRTLMVDRQLPPRGFRGPDGNLSAMALIEPWLWMSGLLLAGAVLITLLWKVARRAGRPSRVLAAALVIAFMSAALLPQLQALSRTKAGEPSVLSPGTPVGPTASATEAARWLRDHSSPDDLVATNAHCVTKAGGCDARHFWIAALTERHVLVEGWAYTNTINDLVTGTGTSSNRLPFWDQQRLEDNDRVFMWPSRESINVLRTQYGVRWLYADASQSPVSHHLRDLATLRYDAGDVQIYDLG